MISPLEVIVFVNRGADLVAGKPTMPTAGHPLKTTGRQQGNGGFHLCEVPNPKGIAFDDV